MCFPLAEATASGVEPRRRFTGAAQTPVDAAKPPICGRIKAPPHRSAVRKSTPPHVVTSRDIKNYA